MQSANEQEALTSFILLPSIKANVAIFLKPYLPHRRPFYHLVVVLSITYKRFLVRADAPRPRSLSAYFEALMGGWYPDIWNK